MEARSKRGGPKEARSPKPVRLKQATIASAGKRQGGKATGGDTLRLVSFFLNGDEYAFEISGAFEVIKPREVTEVPQVPDFIRGILSVRGEMLPVMDLKARLGIASPEDDYISKRILIAGGEECKAGFMVDGIGAIKEFKAKSLKRLKRKQGFLTGTVTSKGDAISLLDIDKLLDI